MATIVCYIQDVCEEFLHTTCSNGEHADPVLPVLLWQDGGQLGRHLQSLRPGRKQGGWVKVSWKWPHPQIITLNELYELMSVFIEIAEGKENNVSVCGHHGHHHQVHFFVGNNWCRKRKTSSCSPIGEAKPILCCDLSCPSWTWPRWWRRCSSWATKTRTMWDCRHPLAWFHLSHIV